MADSRQPVSQSIIRGFFRLLMYLGAAVFLLGDKFLHEIMHVDFLFSEVFGILGGLLLMLLGAGLGARVARASKTPELDRGNG